MFRIHIIKIKLVKLLKSHGFYLTIYLFDKGFVLGEEQFYLLENLLDFWVEDFGITYQRGLHLEYMREVNDVNYHLNFPLHPCQDG